MEGLRTERFPNSELSYFDIINTEFNVLFDKLFLFDMAADKLEEIRDKLAGLIEIINYLPSGYKIGTKEDYEKFYAAVKEEVKPSAIALHRLTGIPYNKNLLQELKDNKSVLYSQNARTQSSGYSRITHKSEAIRIILEGYKWSVYCRQNNISAGGQDKNLRFGYI